MHHPNLKSHGFLSLTLLCSVMACSGPDGKGSVQDPTTTTHSNSLDADNSHDTTQREVYLANESCQELPSLPLWIPSAPGGLFISGFSDPCENKAFAYKEGSGFLTTGLPCTRHYAATQIKGLSYAPKLLQFPIQVDCESYPSDPGSILQLIRNHVDIGTSETVYAHTPVRVVYWHFPEWDEEGYGHIPTLSKPKALSDGWRKLLNGELTDLHLYGVENSWNPSGEVFFFQVQMRVSPSMKFTFIVKQARHLSSREVTDLKKRCLSQQRRCPDIP